MPHLKAQILGPTDWWKVETTNGTCWVLCEDLGVREVKAEDLLDLLPSDNYDTQDIIQWEYYRGYGVRLTEPDETPWEVYDSEYDAKIYFSDEHQELCPICLTELDGDGTCAACVRDLDHETFLDALGTVLQGVTVNEILHTVPGIYEIIAEEYNNEALNQAYEDMRLRYEAKDPDAQRADEAQARDGTGTGQAPA